MRTLMVAAVVVVGLAGCADRQEQPGAPAALAPVPGALPPPAGQQVLAPLGYGSSVIAAGLTDPRALVLTPTGTPLVVEGSAARLTAVQAGGTLVPLATGGGNGPWTGAALLGDRIYVAESGGPLGGRILRVGPKGGLRPLPVTLPGNGQVGPLAAGPDNALYVGIAAPAGANSAEPCRPHPHGGAAPAASETCTGSVLRISPDGRSVEAYAWGFRRPVGLAFTPAGRLLVADDLAEAPTEVGTPMAAADPLWQVAAGEWYGWPPSGGELASAAGTVAAPNPPPPPAARLPGQVSSLAVAQAPAPAFGAPGRAFVGMQPAAASGEQTGEIAFVGPGDERPQPFVTNLIRPTALAFAPDGTSLWVLDGGTGRLWRITRY